MLNSHCNNNDKKILKKNIKKNSCGQPDANPRYTDCKITTLRSSVLTTDKWGKDSAVSINDTVY